MEIPTHGLWIQWNSKSKARFEVQLKNRIFSSVLQGPLWFMITNCGRFFTWTRRSPLGILFRHSIQIFSDTPICILIAHLHDAYHLHGNHAKRSLRFLLRSSLICSLRCSLRCSLKYSTKFYESWEVIREGFFASFWPPELFTVWESQHWPDPTAKCSCSWQIN